MEKCIKQLCGTCWSACATKQAADGCEALHTFGKVYVAATLQSFLLLNNFGKGGGLALVPAAPPWGVQGKSDSFDFLVCQEK